MEFLTPGSAPQLTSGHNFVKFQPKNLAPVFMDKIEMLALNFFAKMHILFPGKLRTKLSCIHLGDKKSFHFKSYLLYTIRETRMPLLTIKS